MPIVTAVGLVLGGGWIALGPIYLLVVIPIGDALSGHDTANPVPGRVLRSGRGHDGILWSWIPLQLAFLGLAVALTEGRSVGAVWGMALATGLVSGAGAINVAHELMHRPNRMAKGASEMLMATVSYGHFCTEHVFGHHRRVATEADPATSRFDEPLYAFWYRSIVGGWKSARVHDRAWSRRHADRMRPWNRRRLLWGALLVAAYGLGGWSGVGLFLVQSLTAVLLLETINYVEHYGLQRERDEQGRFVRVQPHHSWNASQRLTNGFLFNLQRHSDHHAHASRPHWALRHFEDVPQLPFGYPTAFLVALVPPLWRRIMNPRVEAWRQQHG